MSDYMLREMRKRQKWDVAFYSVICAALLCVLLIGLATLLLARQPATCDHVSEVAYNSQDKPICVIVRRTAP